MKITLNTNLVPMFTGTYESPIWEVRELTDSGDEVQVEYDFKEFMKTIVHAYKNKEEYILSELNAPFIKKITFTGEFYNPREYNFTTDSIDFEIEVDRAEMIKSLEALDRDNDFSEFLHDNFTSRSGFISFTPNNFAGIYLEITNELEHFDQAVSALIQYLAKDTLEAYGSGCSIEEMVAEDWQGNGYLGLDYRAICWECNSTVDYDFEYECQNTKCARFKKVEQNLTI